MKKLYDELYDLISNRDAATADMTDESTIETLYRYAAGNTGHPLHTFATTATYEDFRRSYRAVEWDVIEEDLEDQASYFTADEFYEFKTEQGWKSWMEYILEQTDFPTADGDELTEVQSRIIDRELKKVWDRTH